MNTLNDERAIDIETSALNIPASIAAGATATSRIIRSFGKQRIAVAVKLSTAGTVRLRLYLDTACTVEKMATDPDALTAGVQREIQVTSLSPFRAFRFEITNTSGSPAAVQALAVTV